jgi:outer membrane protein
MLKKMFTLSLVTLLAFVGVVGKAHAEEKIALVSLQRALNEVEEGKRAKAKLKKDFDLKKKEIDTMKVDLETNSKGLEKEKLVLSQDALKQKTQGLQSKYIELQTKAAAFERDLKTQEAESAQRILGELRQIVTTVSQSGGYTLVIENSAETVLFSRNAEDITDQVIAAYNKKK